MTNTILIKNSLSLSQAQAILTAARNKAQEMNLKEVIAVCDESGILKAFYRMDGAPFMSVQVAQDKAKSAASFGIPTDGWYNLIAKHPALLNGVTTGIEHFTIISGGYPIQLNQEVVGGIGVSGSPNPAQDMEVAQAGLAGLTDALLSTHE